MGSRPDCLGWRTAHMPLGEGVMERRKQIGQQPSHVTQGSARYRVRMITEVRPTVPHIFRYIFVTDRDRPRRCCKFGSNVRRQPLDTLLKLLHFCFGLLALDTLEVFKSLKIYCVRVMLLCKRGKLLIDSPNMSGCSSGHLGAGVEVAVSEQYAYAEYGGLN